ncbi:dihydrofolate reductase [Lapidilactobacillus bayanensis]|uniref:dihydrofolate reductase n=1 Tax=Lapidilactobacillus bayanensis TaxID=2485998 RepID=UPI0013DE0C49|nr:dihydrofolate reductase [Lapidilactobacillus bayanensis]
MLAFIWAEDQQHLIGNQGQLPWHLPADLRHFQQLTVGQTIIMGRKTYDSFPNGPLPRRQNWVLTTQSAANFPMEVRIFNDVQQIRAAIATAPEQNYFIIGGGSLFEAFAAEVDVLYQTAIKATYQGDVYFPELAWSAFELVHLQIHPATAETPKFSFNEYRRRSNAD